LLEFAETAALEPHLFAKEFFARLYVGDIVV